MPVSFDMKALQTALERTPKRLEQEMALAFRRHNAYFIRQMDRRFGANLQAGRNPTSDRMASRTGALRRSIRGRTIRGGTVNSLRMIATIGNAKTAKYVFTQEHGATIKGNPWLTVPLPDNLTSTGRTRFASAKDLRQDSEITTFLKKTEGGSLVIFRKLKDGQLRPLWVLKRSVKVPARLGFRKTFKSKKVSQDRIKRMNNAVAAALAAFERGAI